MSAVTGVLNRLEKNGQKPVVRVRGCWASSRMLMSYFPASVEAGITYIHLSEVKSLRFVIEEQGEGDEHRFRLLAKPFTAVSERVLGTFLQREDAVEAMRRLSKVLAPNPWRWVWRGGIAVALAALLIPQQRPAASASHASLSGSAGSYSGVVMPPSPLGRTYQQPQAPQIVTPPAGYGTPSVSTSLPLPSPGVGLPAGDAATAAPAPAAAAVAPALDDPFGLKFQPGK